TLGIASDFGRSHLLRDLVEPLLCASDLRLNQLWCSRVRFFLLDYFNARFLWRRRSLFNGRRRVFGYRRGSNADQVLLVHNDRRRSLTPSELPIVILSVIAVVMLGAAHAIQRENLCGHAIEKISVVTDRDDRSLIRGQRFFKRFARRNVEMVGR